MQERQERFEQFYCFVVDRFEPVDWADRILSSPTVFFDKYGLEQDITRIVGKVGASKLMFLF